MGFIITHDGSLYYFPKAQTALEALQLFLSNWTSLHITDIRIQAVNAKDESTIVKGNP